MIFLYWKNEIILENVMECTGISSINLGGHPAWDYLSVGEEFRNNYSGSICLYSPLCPLFVFLQPYVITVFLIQGWPNKSPHDLTVGLKLEAIHPSDPTAIRVSSVVRIFDEYCFLVQVDTLLTQNDVENSFVAHKGSSRIFPVGFCSDNGITLEHPNG